MLCPEITEQIFWTCHVSHPPSSGSPRKIDKVKLLLDHLLPKFQAAYLPTRNLAVDETMIGFRGHLGSLQYVPKKPTKWGIKAYTLADSANAYVLNTLVYTGRETLESSSSDNELPQSARILMHLMKPYLEKGYHTFTDRYYTRVPLVQALARHNTSFTGMCNRARVLLPDEIRQPLHLPDNGVLAYRWGWLLRLAWRAPQKKVPVTMLSSESCAKMCVVQPHNKHSEPVEKPTVINEYNKSTNGVDIADQLSVYYPFIWKTKKWWRKLAFWLLELSCIQAHQPVIKRNSCCIAEVGGGVTCRNVPLQYEYSTTPCWSSQNKTTTYR